MESVPLETLLKRLETIYLLLDIPEKFSTARTRFLAADEFKRRKGLAILEERLREKILVAVDDFFKKNKTTPVARNWLMIDAGVEPLTNVGSLGFDDLITLYRAIKKELFN